MSTGLVVRTRQGHREWYLSMWALSRWDMSNPMEVMPTESLQPALLSASGGPFQPDGLCGARHRSAQCLGVAPSLIRFEILY